MCTFFLPLNALMSPSLKTHQSKCSNAINI